MSESAAEPLIMEIALHATAPPSAHGMLVLRIWLGQNKQDLAVRTGHKRQDVERWEMGDAAIPALVWDALVAQVDKRLDEATRSKK